MPFEIYRTTAEHVIGASDAALQSQDGVDEQMLASFLDTTSDYASDALQMAEQLCLLKRSQQGLFIISSTCVPFLATSKREKKAAILRFVIEQYEPFKIFKNRLEITTGVVGEAATQTKAICGIGSHRDVIASTLIDLGTYANAITSQGGGLYVPVEDNHVDYLKVLNEVITDRQTTELFLIRRMGRDVIDWLNRNDVLENLITAYQRLNSVEEDPNSCIVHAANAFESFLSQLADHYNVNIQGANGINAKADRLGQAGHLTTKHKFMSKYLGHVRNAADHGVDQEIQQQWSIGVSTAIEYVHVALSIIKNLVKAKDGNFII